MSSFLTTSTPQYTSPSSWLTMPRISLCVLHLETHRELHGTVCVDRSEMGKMKTCREPARLGLGHDSASGSFLTTSTPQYTSPPPWLTVPHISLCVLIWGCDLHVFDDSWMTSILFKRRVSFVACGDVLSGAGRHWRHGDWVALVEGPIQTLIRTRLCC